MTGKRAKRGAEAAPVDARAAFRLLHLARLDCRFERVAELVGVELDRAEPRREVLEMLHQQAKTLADDHDQVAQNVRRRSLENGEDLTSSEVKKSQLCLVKDLAAVLRNL